MTSRPVLTEDGAKRVFKTLSSYLLNPASQTLLYLTAGLRGVMPSFCHQRLFEGVKFAFYAQP